MMELFQIFDLDHNNVVDWIELLSGICLLCGGSTKEKINVLFEIYDINEDGVLSFKELYLLLENNLKILF
jgi:Ca2+-binding EF-hand superfamily protein